MDHVQHVVEIGAHDVHLIDVNHAGNMVVVSLSPDGLGLRLNAALCTQNGNAAVQHAQGALHLNGEVNVTRGVYDVDTGIAPETGGSSGSDGDASLLLLLHPVHGGGTLMGLTYLVVDAGVVQNTLGSRSLAGINVSHDTNISGFFK